MFHGRPSLGRCTLTYFQNTLSTSKFMCMLMMFNYTIHLTLKIAVIYFCLCLVIIYFFFSLLYFGENKRVYYYYLSFLSINILTSILASVSKVKDLPCKYWWIFLIPNIIAKAWTILISVRNNWSYAILTISYRRVALKVNLYYNELKPLEKLILQRCFVAPFPSRYTSHPAWALNNWKLSTSVCWVC